MNLGILYHEMKSYEGSIEQFNEIRDSAYKEKVLNYRGLSNMKLGRYTEAEADFQESVELRPQNYLALNNLGLTRYRQSRFEEAVEDFTRSIEVYSSDHIVWYNRGLAYYDLQKYAESVADLDQSINLCPEDPNLFK